MSDNPEKKEEGDAPQIEAGTVMQCGATDYWAIGRTKDVRIEYQNLQVPTRLKALEVRPKICSLQRIPMDFSL